MAVLHVEKAFDRVRHCDIFEALLESGVRPQLVTSLRSLYSDL